MGDPLPQEEESISGLPLYCAGVVNYRSYDDLVHCLETVRGQTFPAAAVMVVDSDPDEEQLSAARERNPEVLFHRVANRGYAGGANRLLALMEERAPEAEFFLILNADIMLDPDFCERLVASMSVRPDVALASGKLLRPGRELLDSAGIRLPLNRRPRDRGSQESDRGQFDAPEYLFGVSGAAMMLRRAALEDLALDGEIFDEDFFVYHEDTDVSWRCHQLGWRVFYEPGARAIHKRGWQSEARLSIPVGVRRHSFKNHYLQIIKNESLLRFISLLPVLLAWEFLRLGFALLKDRPILRGYLDAARLTPRAFRKRRILRDKIRSKKQL